MLTPLVGGLVNELSLVDARERNNETHVSIYGFTNVSHTFSFNSERFLDV